MCGLFGVVSRSGPDTERANRALDRLTHRGPDQRGCYVDDRVFLGHRRLSILDLSESGQQPMVSADGQLVIAVNGEIYNYRQLRSRLINSGYRFSSNSDSEVVLHGYHAWGIDGLLESMEGMFAVVIYDKSRQRLYLCRDRIGIKPLYLACVNGVWCWASELKAIHSYFTAALEVDYSAIYDYLTYLYIPAPKSLYRQVKKLIPGDYIELDIDKETSRTHAYWRLQTGRYRYRLRQEAVEDIRATFTDSVRHQLISDVPVSVFTSSGVDSSIVTAVAASLSSEISAISMGFGQHRDESKEAERFCNQINIPIHRQQMSEQMAMKQMSSMSEMYDEPFADTSALPFRLLSDFARSHCKVALSGDGGDELFSGYSVYDRFSKLSKPHLKKLMPWIGRLNGTWQAPKPVKRTVNCLERLLTLEGIELYARLRGGMLRHEKTGYRQQWELDSEYDDYWAFRKWYREDLPVTARLRFLDIHTYLPDDILTKVDRASMAASLEVRVPVLATELVEKAFSIPDVWHLHEGRTKSILMDAFKCELNARNNTLAKQGFSIPRGKWKQLEADNSYYWHESLLEVFENISGQKNSRPGI